MSGEGGRAPSWLLRMLVRWLPAGFREAYGPSILETFRAAWAERRARRGRLAALAFTLLAFLDLVLTVARERARSGGSERVAWGTDLRGDVRHALRSLRRSPGFTAAALAVLSLAIGVNTAVFTAFRAVILAPPPYPDPDRLVLVRPSAPAGSAAGASTLWSHPKFRLLGEVEDPAIAPLAGFARRQVLLEWGGESVRAWAETVSHTYLPMLGARPALGRLFTAEEDDPSSPALVAVVAHGFWMSAFGGDPDLRGLAVRMGARELTIVGVAEPGFDGLTGTVDLWLPMSAARVLSGPSFVDDPGLAWFQVVGRTGAGVGPEDAATWAARATRQVHGAFEGAAAVQGGASIQSLREARSRPEARAAVVAMAGAAVMVLLVGCANLAGLLVARGGARVREIAVRAALGAGRGRVLRQLLVESLALALVGGVAGTFVAHFATRLLRAHWPARFTADATGWLRSFDPGALRLDPTVVGFAAALAMVTTLLFGVLPALRLSRAGPGEALRSVGRGTAGVGARGLDGRAALISCEVALAFVLLVGATLMSSSMVRLLGVERGFETPGLLTFRYSLPSGGESAPAILDRHAAFLERLAGDPRVLGVALGCVAPLSGWCRTVPVPRPGTGTAPPMEASPQVGVHAVSDAYFETLGTSLLDGRAFTPADGPGSSPVAIVNRTAARLMFGDGDAIGRPLPIPQLAGEDGVAPMVVGVVADVLQGRPYEDVTPELYVPFRQSPSSAVAAFVRTSGPPLDLVPLASAHLRALEPRATLSAVATGAELVARATADTRALLWLLGTFAGSAVALAAFGIWTVVAYTVGRRTRELGVRMALGARAHQVIFLVARGAAAAAGAGVLLGLGGAYLASGLLSRLVFGITPTDPFAYLVAALGFACVALLASALPALRATRADPVRAMRVE